MQADESESHLCFPIIGSFHLAHIHQHGCDAKLTHPKPCSRCAAKGVECIVDVQFRRTPARERLSKLNHEIDSLRQSLRDATAERAHLEPSTLGQEAEVSESPDIATGGEGLATSFCGTSEMLLDIQDDQIGDCALPRDELIPLFST